MLLAWGRAVIGGLLFATVTTRFLWSRSIYSYLLHETSHGGSPVSASLEEEELELRLYIDSEWNSTDETVSLSI